MRVNITFRHMEGTEAIKEHVTKKVERARKYLQGPCEAHVVMSTERHLHRCDVTINAAGWTFKGAEETEDMYTSVDKVMDKVERQIRKMKGREQARNAPGAESTREAMIALEEGDTEEEGTTEEGSAESEEKKGETTEAAD
jgi:putative sigma-54 modulation protein